MRPHDPFPSGRPCCRTCWPIRSRLTQSIKPRSAFVTNSQTLESFIKLSILSIDTLESISSEKDINHHQNKAVVSTKRALMSHRKRIEREMHSPLTGWLHNELARRCQRPSSSTALCNFVFSRADGFATATTVSLHQNQQCHLPCWQLPASS